MGAASGMPKVYYDVYNNIKANFEKTGRINGKAYSKWEGLADQRAHAIAKSIANKRSRTNKDLLDELDYYYKKAKEVELKKSFEHPDYKHVHSNEYDSGI